MAAATRRDTVELEPFRQPAATTFSAKSQKQIPAGDRRPPGFQTNQTQFFHASAPSINITDTQPPRSKERCKSPIYSVKSRTRWLA